MTEKRRPLQIYLRENQMAALRYVAEQRGESIAALVREGVDLLLDQLPADEDPLFQIVGLYNSGIGDLADKHDEYLTESLKDESGNES